jgi:HlyD family secretion protein
MKALVPLQKVPHLLQGARNWLTLRYEPTMMPEALPFLNPIDAICNEPPPKLMWSTHYILVALFLCILLVASVARIDTVVVGSGSLITEQPPTILQPYERSIMRELRVHPGDLVKKGQVLAVLDPTFAQADLATAGAQQRSAQAQVKRLEAELSGAPLEMSANPDSDETLQHSLYLQRQEQYKSRLKVFDEDIQRLDANIKASEQDKASLSQQLGFAKDLEAMRGSLMQTPAGSKLNYLDAQTLRVRTEREYNDAANHLVDQQHALQSKQAERQSFIDDWRRQILESLSAARAEATRYDEAMSKASLVKKLVEVVSPVDGAVQEVAKRSVGSVVREAEPLITIMPSDTPLIADITVSSSDVGHIRAGDEVVIKVDAFPYQRHGFLKGRLLYVSEDSHEMAEAGGEAQGAEHGMGAVHKARVALTDTELHNLPEGAHLIPGMSLSAEIKVGTRRLISFFTYPLTRGLDESLREP